MVRVLQVVTYMGRGGLETMLMNYYRNIDRDIVQFDFLVHRSFEAEYDAEILKMGGHIYHLPTLNPFSISYHKKLNAFLKEHSYDVVHSHLDCMSAYPLAYAKNMEHPCGLLMHIIKIKIIISNTLLRVYPEGLCRNMLHTYLRAVKKQESGCLESINFTF